MRHNIKNSVKLKNHASEILLRYFLGVGVDFLGNYQVAQTALNFATALSEVSVEYNELIEERGSVPNHSIFFSHLKPFMRKREMKQTHCKSR